MSQIAYLRLALLAAMTLLFSGENSSAADVDFSRDILPILSDNCFHCHGPDVATREAELRLDTKEGALRAESPIIVAGKSGESELLRRILSDDSDEVMPPESTKRKLTDNQKELVRQWIDSGAQWSRHWAFVKPVRPTLSNEKNEWVRNPIDRLVLRQLVKRDLRPMPEADRRTLLRRVTFDLTGLPPTQEALSAFLADTKPGAYERVVDRLLQSKHYGERMAWDWLDIARYADTNGYQGDRTRTMWPWRDWVVQAFNDNMPYDRFTIEQLAGDMLPEPTMEQRIATGFHRNHMINGEGGRIAEENRVEYIFDQVETTATTWLGLTMTCSRCHDHKYDPIQLKDYYGLFAIFNNTPVNGGGGSGQTAPVVEYYRAGDREKLSQLRGEVARIGKQVDEQEVELFPRPDGKKAADSEETKGLPQVVLEELKRPAGKRNVRRIPELIKAFEKKMLNAKAPEYIKSLQQLRAAMEKRDGFSAQLPRVMVMQEAKPRETFILVRGAYNKPDRKTPPALIASLHAPPQNAPIHRLTLARWLVDTDNPLTARVTVNRYWQMLFGSGLVRTPEDFGVQGAKPTHPELLDWLAVEFVESGWNVKQLLRTIVTSAAYRQSSHAGAAAYANDPDNRWLGRGPRFRLPSWMLRDQALAISGLLNREFGGPSVKSYQPPGVWAEATFGKIKYNQDTGDKLYRRSLYLFWRRIVGPTTFFDVAKRQTCEVKPPRTNTPLHALVTMNDVTYVEAARVFAENVIRAQPDSDRRLRLAFQSATGRPPTKAEHEVLKRKLEQFSEAFKDDAKAAENLAAMGEQPRAKQLSSAEVAAYTSLCNLILNLDEVVTKE